MFTRLVDETLGIRFLHIAQTPVIISSFLEKELRSFSHLIVRDRLRLVTGYRRIHVSRLFFFSR
jgi:CRP-like cAMP-binding protein